MSWPMVNPAQWNPNAMMPQDMNNMNMASMTQEQWSAMQQQNWQQWSQWQHQYAQWHKQYGDKYAQQMQTYSVGNIPPPPSTAGPQPPPPPDKPPPPPPPHENNQPLFGNNKTQETNQFGNKSQPAPVPPPPQRNASYSNTNPIPTNTTSPQWSSNEPKQPQPSVNTEALKKLAEEERLFDIQFKKWEEEIDKWRKENVNHPDKQAYKEYEQRFEACRAQLMERREQMKQKRSRLMNTAANPNVPSTTIPTIGAPPTNNYDQGSNFSHTAYNSQQNLPQTYQNTAKLHQQPEPVPPVSNSNNITINAQDSFDSYKKSDASYSSQKNVPSHSDTSFLPTSSSSKGIPGLDLVPEPTVNQPEIIDITEEGNKNQGPDYSTISQGINSILGDEKIMNILSMVRGDVSQNAPLTNNQNNAQQQMFGNQQRSNFGMGPDSQHPASSGMQQDQYSYGGNNMRPGNNMGYNNQGMGPGGPNMRPGGPNMGPGRPNMGTGGSNMGPGGPNRGSGGPNMGPGRPNMGPGGPNMGPSGPNMGPGGPNMGPSGPNMGPGGPNMGPGGSNMRPGGPNMGPGGPNMGSGGPNMGSGGPNMGPGGPNMGSGGPNMGSGGPNMGNNSGQRPNGPDMRQGGQNMRPPGPGMQYGMQQGNQNYRFSGPNNLGGPNGGGGQQQQFNNGPRPLMQTIVQRPHRPLQENVPPQQNPNANKFYNEQEGPMNENIPPVVNQPPRPKWVEEPLFTPSIVVEYEHKPLRLKARDFIEPVHTFDYNHRSKDEDLKRKAIEKEADELFVRKPRREREEDDERYSRDLFYRDERRPAREARDNRLREPVRGELMRDFRERPREETWEEFPRERPRDPENPRDLERPRDPERPRDLERPREEFDRRRDDRYDDRRRDDRDRVRRDDFRDHRDRERDDFRDYRRRDEKDFHRDRNRDVRRSDSRNRSRSRDRDSRKRGLSRESEVSNNSKKAKEASITNKHIVMIDDILEPPGRDMRPAKIVIIMRGPPGSGKSYLAKLIRDREAEYGGTARVMSIDDYFMQEGEIEEKDPVTGKIVKKPTLKYEYDDSSEEIYMTSLKRAFKRSLTDGYFSFLIFDAVNDTLKSYADIWNYARQNCFQVYICTMDLDAQACFKRNIHNRSLSDIQTIIARFFPTPDHHIQLDPTTLLQNAAITDVQMEDVQDDVIEVEPEVETVFTSKWEKMDDANQLARLDGTSKPLRSSQPSMEDYLQLDEWKPNVAKPGKKTVRWADIEERRKQEKMRAIGFVVGQTDWNRMTDPTMGSSALTQTKYIERVKKKF